MYDPVLRRIAAGAIVSLAITATAPAAELIIPGSGNPEYVLGVLAKEFNARQKRHQVSVPPSTGTAGAIRDVTEEKAVLGRVGRPLKDAERAKGLDYLPVGRDAVVFVGGAGVSVRSVTSSQMMDAYAGKVIDWRDFGGKPGPIRAVGREITDASRQALAAHIKEFQDVVWGPSVKLVQLDPQMIELLDRFETSVGFINRSALYAARTKVVPLALDSIEPTLENLASGRYPVWLEFGFIHRSGTLPEEARAFVAFIRSPEGQRVMRAHGVVPAASGA